MHYTNIFPINDKTEYYWKCKHTCKDVPECGHHWRRNTIKQKKSKGCPFCNKFATYSDPCCYETSSLGNGYVMFFWDEVKNTAEGVFLENLPPFSQRIVWFICRNNCKNSHCLHSWAARIINVSLGKGCPFCSARRICCEQKSAKNVSILRESFADDHVNNKGIDLATLTQHNANILIWRCLNICNDNCTHEWPASVASRQ